MDIGPKPSAQSGITRIGITPTPPPDSKSAPAIKPNATRNLNLDITRAIAVILVVGVHFHTKLPNGFVQKLAAAWNEIGPFGVHLFFVLSGFLVGGLLLDELNKYGQINVVRFLIRRGFKIYPGYYLFISYCIFFPAVKLLPDVHAAIDSLGDHLKSLTPNLFFIQNYIGQNPEGHTWSLAVEEHFYFLLPCILLLLIRAKLSIKLLGALPLFLMVCLLLRLWAQSSGASLRSMLWWTHLHIDALFLGVWLNYIMRQDVSVARWIRGNSRVLLFTGMICVLAFYLIPLGREIRLTAGYTVTYLSACAIVAGVVCWQPRSHDLPSKPDKISLIPRTLGVIGRSSYSIYLWHITVLGICERLFGGLFEKAGFPAGLSWILVAGITLMFAITVGILLTRFVELPFLMMRDRFFPSRASAVR